MKKIAIAVSSVALAGFSTASIAATPSFFVGAQAGYQNVDLEYSERASLGSFSASYSSDYSLDGLSGGVFAGVRFDMNSQIYLATEINLGSSNSKGEASFSQTETFNGGSEKFADNYKIESDMTYGISFLAGYKFTEATSLYGRLGYQRTKFKASYNESSSATDQNFIDFDSFSESDSKTFGGIRFGVGMETAISSNASLRLDWSQTHYSSETFGEIQGVSTTFDPTESLFQAGVVLRF